MKVPRSVTRHRSFIHRTLAGTVLGAGTGGLGSVTKDVQKANQRYSLVITRAPEAAQGWRWGRGGGGETEEGIVGAGGGGDLLGSECCWLPGPSQAESGCEGGRGRSRRTLHLCSSGPDLVQEGPRGAGGLRAALVASTETLGPCGASPRSWTAESTVSRVLCRRHVRVSTAASLKSLTKSSLPLEKQSLDSAEVSAVANVTGQSADAGSSLGQGTMASQPEPGSPDSWPCPSTGPLN